MDEQQFMQTLTEKGIKLNTEQIEQFSTYYSLLVKWNDKVNLTAITEKNEVYLKHFFDSITPAFYTNFNEPLTLCDVGAGAGFPSIPLKICFPNIQLTIVDSLKKRINFLKTLAKELNLKNIEFHHSRAEDFAQQKDFREKFDRVIARAVARTSVLSELCLPLTKVGGQFIVMKGSKGEEELVNAKAAIKRLGGKTVDRYSFTLPKEESERTLYFIEKVKQTPKRYPRNPGTPQRKPIK